jgi:ribosome modulation factor
MTQTSEAPQGISDRQFGYYNQGRAAHAEGLPKAAAVCVFETKNRAWWLAGWHDADIEKQEIAA